MCPCGKWLQTDTLFNLFWASVLSWAGPGPVNPRAVRTNRPPFLGTPGRQLAGTAPARTASVLCGRA